MLQCAMAFRSIEPMLLITSLDTSLTRRTLANTFALRINFLIFILGYRFQRNGRAHWALAQSLELCRKERRDIACEQLHAGTPVSEK